VIGAYVGAVVAAAGGKINTQDVLAASVAA
jgi:hypothetical protein